MNYTLADNTVRGYRVPLPVICPLRAREEDDSHVYHMKIKYLQCCKSQVSLSAAPVDAQNK